MVTHVRAGSQWSRDERLMQLAGHLRGKAKQEWCLMSLEGKASYDQATRELARRLDPGSRIMAVQACCSRGQ